MGATAIRATGVVGGPLADARAAGQHLVPGQGGRGLLGPALVVDHVDHHHRDVVAPALGPGLADQVAGRLLGVGQLAQGGGDAVVAQLVGEAVAAEQEPVAPVGDELPRVDLDLGLHAQGPGDDRALGVDLGLLPGELALPDQLLDQAVVVGELEELAVLEEVGPGVAHVGQGQQVVAVLVRRGPGR